MTEYAKAIGGPVYHQLRDDWRPELGRQKSLCGVLPNSGWATPVETKPEGLCYNCIAVIGDFYAGSGRADEHYRPANSGE